MYRIFSYTGGAYDDILVKSLLQAAADGPNVISMSFGELWADEASNPYNALATNLVDKGIAVFAANGNDGSYGIFGTSAPALSTNIFAVGSVDNEKYPVTYKLVDPNGRSLRNWLVWTSLLLCSTAQLGAIGPSTCESRYTADSSPFITTMKCIPFHILGSFGTTHTSIIRDRV
jgi:subtilisin family serine protease